MGFNDGPPIATFSDSRSMATAGNGGMRLIATRLRAETALLGAGMIATALALFAGCAEEAGQKSGPPAATRSATQVVKPRLPGKEEPVASRASRLQTKRDWWNHAREVLFSGIEISAEQTQGVDAIVDEQLDKRARLLEGDTEYYRASKSNDPERIDAARTALRATRAQLKEPYEIYDALRTLLSEEQLPTFDMNRARLVAEGQAPARERAVQTEQRNRAKPKTR
jgi:hypothetical protein